MPIYEFDCRDCETRFESLVPVGTQSLPCPTCGSQNTARIMSLPGAPMKLVKSRGAAARQEASNAKLHTHTKARFKKAVGKIHDAKKRSGGGGGEA